MPVDPARAKSLFLTASELPAVDRAAFLNRECGGDFELRGRVEALLRADNGAPISVDATGGFDPNRGTADLPDGDAATGTIRTGAHRPESIATGAQDSHGPTDTYDVPPPRWEPSPTIELGTVIAGRYTLVEVIGEGGMGSVYLAEQSEPVKRQVALKLIKTGMDSKAVLARFDAERQALALMDHPNIARIYDGGVTPAGQPFFVMELVKGVPLTDYCDSKRLSVDARLQLFVSVCQAVQHAHQKGIIHRDLKPGNVLVTEVDGRPTPKVIDFGVAKATELKLTDMSFADTGAIVGTPAYMSPEQADPSSMDIDTRTDVYALGVMLYELLTGSPPIDSKQFKRGAILEMLRMVREVEPPRPSTKLSTAEALPNIAANRSIEPAKLAKLLQGELDWVVMKALDKDRTRRYDSANGLAQDLQRYLADEVVEARPPSRGYRLKKFVKRNKGQVVAAALVLMALVSGILGTSLGLVRAIDAEQLARDEQQKVQTERDEKERARSAEEVVRKRAELQAADMRIDAVARESSTNIYVGARLRLLRFTQTLEDLPDHAVAHRRHLTHLIVREAQLLRPWWATGRQTHFAVFVHQDLPDAIAEGWDGAIRVCDPITGRVLSTIQEPGRYLRLAGVGGDGRRIVLEASTRKPSIPDFGEVDVSDDHHPEEATVQYFVFIDLPSGNRVASTPVFNQRQSVGPISRDGRWFITNQENNSRGQEDSQVTVWNTASGKAAFTRPAKMASFSPDSGMIVCSGNHVDNPARVYATSDGRRIATLKDPGGLVWLAYFSVSGKSVVTLTHKQVRWWSTNDWKSTEPATNQGSLRADADDSAVDGSKVRMRRSHPYPDAEQGLTPALIRDDYLVPFDNLWRNSGPQNYTGLPLELCLRGRTEPINESGRIAAAEDDRLLFLSGKLYQFGPGVPNVIVPPKGRRFPDAARQLAPDGGLLTSHLVHGRAVDFAADRVCENYLIPVNNHGNPLLCLSFLDNTDESLSDFPRTLPRFEVDLPIEWIVAWAKLVATGELSDRQEFIAWDEATWQRRLQDFVAKTPHTVGFPLHESIVAQPDYWLQVRLRDTILPDERLILLNRLLAAKPDLHFFEARYSLHWEQGRLDDAVRDRLEADKLYSGGPRVRYLSRSTQGRNPTVNLGRHYNRDLYVAVALTPGLRAASYEAALKRARDERKGVGGRESYDGKTLNEMLSGCEELLMYRLGQYEVAERRLKNIAATPAATICSMLAPASPWTVLGMNATHTMTGRFNADHPGWRSLRPTQGVVLAMCQFRLNKVIEARAQFATHRSRGGVCDELVKEAAVLNNLPAPKKPLTP